MKYLLDTHIVIWWLTDDCKLFKAHGKLLEKSERSGTPVGSERAHPILLTLGTLRDAEVCRLDYRLIDKATVIVDRLAGADVGPRLH